MFISAGNCNGKQRSAMMLMLFSDDVQKGVISRRHPATNGSVAYLLVFWTCH